VLPVKVVSPQQAPVLGHQQEQKPVNQPEKVPVKPFGVRPGTGGTPAQKAVGQQFEALLDPVPEPIPRPVALGQGLLVVALQPAFVPVGHPGGQPAPVNQPVKEVKLPKTLPLEDGLQVELYVGLTPEQGRFAQEAQHPAVGYQAPEAVGAVQRLLKEGVGRKPGVG
jgi:hypothetical protein